jgi:CheY-like chemotaxis protein
LNVKDHKAATKVLKKQVIDCVIVTPDSVEILERLDLAQENSDPMIKNRMPVIVYGDGSFDEDLWKGTGKPFSLRRVYSRDRLRDLVAFNLHRNVDKLSPDWQKKIVELHHSDKVLAGRKVLVVDDDARNIFALTSVLEEHNMVIVSADSGREAINVLQSQTDVDIVLMDIMMPEMDGMETIREIRKISRLKDLPIVAVTAKAMKGDREKCIDAGAWDYLSKPVDTEQLMKVVRAWLHR